MSRLARKLARLAERGEKNVLRVSWHKHLTIIAVE
jgi:hypothetical protein